jgi:Photosynthesis affected mutant 68
VAENEGNKVEKLPFEPASNKSSSKSKSVANRRSDGDRSANQTTIPEVVSQRMGRRMAFFSGLPSLLGVLTFLAGYYLIKFGGVKLPNEAVFLVSLGFFGIGVLGLSYGILSTSWDEVEVGSLLGKEQFDLNLGRIADAWRVARNTKKPD